MGFFQRLLESFKGHPQPQPTVNPDLALNAQRIQAYQKIHPTPVPTPTITPTAVPQPVQTPVTVPTVPPISDAVASSETSPVLSKEQQRVANIVKKKAVKAFGESEWPAIQELIIKESSLDPNAQNPNSSAYGLFQFLNGTWGQYGGKRTNDPNIQTDLGLKYIKDRYGSPSQALEFHKQNGWY